MQMTTRSVLAELVAGFEARGWAPTDLTQYRMQMAPEALEGAPTEGASGDGGSPSTTADDGGGDLSSGGESGTPAGGPARGADGKFAKADGTPADDPDGSGFEELDYDSLLADGAQPVSPEQIKRMAAEHKAYRQKFGPVAQAFRGYHDEDAKALTQFVADFANPDTRAQAATWMRSVLDRLTPAEAAKLEADVKAAAGEQTPPVEEEFDPFDPAQIDARINAAVEARLAQEDQERETRAEHDKLIARGKELGYSPDPRDPDWATLLFVAKSQFPNDSDALGRAHAVIEERLNKRATAILEQKRQDATVPTAPQEGQTPGGPTKPKTMRDAERSAAERLESIFHGPQR